MPFVIFITPKVTVIWIQTDTHLLELIQLVRQGIQPRDNINYSSIWIAGRSFVSSSPVWSHWNVTVSNSVQGDRSEPSEHPCEAFKESVDRHGVWTDCWLLLSIDTTVSRHHITDRGKNIQRSTMFLKRLSAWSRLNGAKWVTAGSRRSNKYLSSWWCKYLVNDLRFVMKTGTKEKNGWK